VPLPEADLRAMINPFRTCGGDQRLPPPLPTCRHGEVV